jgi:outer membrane protein assembly factor BamB
MLRYLAVLFLPVASFTRGDEFATDKFNHWHHWRGPLATGVAPNATPPTHWDEKTNIKWKVELSGRGSATPIVWGDRVFIVTAIKTDQQIDPSQLPKIDPKFEKKTERPTHFYQFVVLCFDRNTGKELWKKIATTAVPHEGHHQTHSYAAGSPTTDGKLLYVSFGSQGIYAYTLDGELKWNRKLSNLNTRLGWGEAVTPTVHGDSLVLNWDQEADSKVIVLDVATGKTKWEQDRDENTSWNTPLVIDDGKRTQVILNGTTAIRSYELSSGKLLWECPGMTVNAIPSPVTDGKAFFIMSGYRGAAAVAIPLSAEGKLADGKVLWRYSKGTPYVPSPLLLNDRLYFSQANTQVFTILNAKTGEALVDRERLPTVKSFYASPVAADGKIYIVDQEGTTLVLKAGDKVEVLATNRLNDAIDASPVLVGQQLFLRGTKYLYCIEESGKK